MSFFFSTIGASPNQNNIQYGILYWGQSNCVGQGISPPAYLQGPLSGVKIGNYNTSFATLQFGVNNQGNTTSNYGLELEMGYRLGEYFNYDVLIGKYGKNGAAIGINEYLGTYGTFRVASNDLYPNLRDTGLALMNEISNVYGKVPKIIAVMIQGWSDCADSTNASTYATNLSDILSQLVTDGVDIVMNIINITHNDVVNRPEIIQANLDLVQAAQSAYTYNIDLNNYVLSPTDYAHYKGQEPISIGYDVSQIIINNF